MGIKTGKPRGRPAGAKNKSTAERQEAMRQVAETISETVEGAFDGDSHALLMTVYKDPKHEWPMRIDAAKAAIRYEKPILAAVELTGKDGGPVQVKITGDDAGLL